MGFLDTSTSSDFNTKNRMVIVQAGIPIRGLRSKDIDRLVWFKGILVRISTVRPKLTTAVFECILCGAIINIPQLTSKVRWPKFCTNKRCKAKAHSGYAWYPVLVWQAQLTRVFYADYFFGTAFQNPRRRRFWRCTGCGWRDQRHSSLT